MLFPGPAIARDAARALAFRAMANLGNGRFDPAWQDILAIHRLANLIEREGTLTEQEVAAEIRRIACDATATLVSQNNVSAKQLRQFQRELSELPEFSVVPTSLDSFERVTYLDSILWLRAGHAEAWGKHLRVSDDVINRIVQVTRLPADWNIILRRGNEQFDQMVAASRIPPGAQRDAAVSKIDANRDRFKKDFGNRIKTIVNLSQQERADLFFEMTINIFATDLRSIMDIQDGANNHLRLTRIAAALANYRTEHAYPAKLDELAPKIMGALPTDISDGAQFLYERSNEGYLLYNRGPNRLDENGSNAKLEIWRGYRLYDLSDVEWYKLKQKIPAGADDLSIRIPIPSFKVPQASPPTRPR
jgi:hypothetical protein